MLKSPGYESLKLKSKAYRKANGFPIGLAYDDEFEAILAEHVLPEERIDFTPPTLAEKASMLGNALWKWAKSGFQVVSHDEMERRLGICRVCPYYGGEKGLVQVACRKCGCSKLKAFLSTSVCPDDPPRW